MARAHSLKPVTILNFENLRDHLGRIRAERSGGFIGCCCEGFYTKHARDFERAGVPGVLVGMDSTTCYDLGKARDAYHGGFQHQTHINLPLLEKVLALRGLVGRTPGSAADAPVGLPAPCTLIRQRDEGVLAQRAPRPGGLPHHVVRNAD
jgi:hypothetical protein